MSKFIEIEGLKETLKALKNLETDSKKQLEQITAYGAKQMAKKAPKGFNRAKYDGTNDVYCYAVRATTEGNALCTYKVTAYSPSGSVAFIEFGSGNGIINSATEPNPFRETVRPKMKELGHYGKGRGSQDYWVFQNNDVSLQHATPNLQLAYDKYGLPRLNVWWTGGNKPARAMWGAKLEFDKKFPEWVVKFGGESE